MARLIEAALAAIRGDTDEARRIVSEVEALCRTLGAEPILDLATSVGILVELSDRRPDAAWDQARTMLRPGEVSASVAYNQGGISLYADAAAESGHQAEGRIVVEEVAALAARSGSDALRIGVAYARARLAGDADVDAAVPAAFASDLARSPFAHARLQLAHGAWLRRQRRISDSRVPLRAARDTFDALGASAWGDRARQELRATGEASRQRAPAAVDQLTPQELEIARLAADGMTNREIGQQLYVSHRTVGSHLSRVYPKLGIRSRVELGRALATPGPSDP
jgi:DNA-binding NarL/FixJ family response regulator